MGPRKMAEHSLYVNDKTCPATEMTQEVQSAGSSFHLDHFYRTLTSPPLRTAENLPPTLPKQNRGPNHHYSGDFESTLTNLYLGKIVRGRETDRRLKSSSNVVSRFLRVKLFLSCSPSGLSFHCTTGVTLERMLGNKEHLFKSTFVNGEV
jgi:hypothetical protein